MFEGGYIIQLLWAWKKKSTHSLFWLETEVLGEGWLDPPDPDPAEEPSELRRLNR